MSTFTLKSIEKVLINNNNTYFCPDYQRGYKWRDEHVDALLDDIDNFTASDNNGQYCLQPIVLHKTKENETTYTLIDGQQRLTTLSIILRYLNEDSIATIDYETRTGSKDFLEKITSRTEEEADKNIDFRHMYDACKTIEKYFSGKSDVEKENFRKKLLKQVSVIWYEIESDTIKDNDVFTRLNSGKIPLTNSELIKALFLQIYDKNSGTEKELIIRQIYRANEWDMIEQTLRNSDFWGFIYKDDSKINNKDDKYQHNRIEYIFDTLLDSRYPKESKNNDDKFIFNKYKELIIDNKERKTNKDKDGLADEEWKEVTDWFYRLEEWYANTEYFHLVGFLVNTGMSIVAIKNLYKDDKQTFTQNLKDTIKAKIGVVNLSELDYDSHKDKIRNILLLFNVATMLQDKKSTVKFRFDLYQSQNWDIEHIYSKATYDKVSEDQEEGLIELNYLGNLALLDSGTNRGYKDAPFIEKRRTILGLDKDKEKDSYGKNFVPICTRNVFVKAYTKLDKVADWDMEDYKKHMSEWTSLDSEDYVYAIKEALQGYIASENKEQNNGK